MGKVIRRDKEVTIDDTDPVDVEITGQPIDTEVSNTVDVNVVSSPGASTNISKNELGYDAWGRAKTIKDNSIFHGMFTYNVPVTTWYETINGVISTTTTNCTSVDGSLNIVAGATLNDDTYLRSYRNPRYEPNRGALYSTAGWITNPTALMTREWGTFTAESGVFFRLKSGGTLVGVLRTTVATVTTDTEITLTIPGTIDLSKGNVYDIQYQWRGVGNYKFFINLVEVGNSETLGTLTQLSIYNPALPVAWNSENLGDNDAMSFGCVDVTSEGGKDNGKTYGSVSITNQIGQVAISGTGNYNIPIIAIRGKLTVGGLINTRDTLALLLSAYSDQRSFLRVWATRDFTAITENSDTWADYGDGHLEYIEYNNGGGTVMTFDTTKAQLIFGCRVDQDTTYSTSALFEGRTEIYKTPGDVFIFTLHRETGASFNGGVTYEFAEAI
jgi:hypothetical protein